MEGLVLGLFIFLFGSFNLSADLKSYAEQSVAKAIVDPARFFSELKMDSEVVFPVNSGKRYTFNVNFLPSLFPFTYLNSSFNYCLYKEGRLYTSFPQIDLIGGAAYMIGGNVLANATNDVNKISVYGYHLGFVFSDSFESKIRIYYGFKHSYTLSRLKLSSSKKHTFLGVNITDFDSKFSDNILVFGVEFLKELNKYWSINVSYGISKQTIVYGVGWYGKWFMMGFNFYPEGIIQIHPYWGMRLGF
jgi:hypothetical protein